MSENFQGAGRWPLHGLDRIRRDYPMALQGVSLSIEPIESRVKPLWVSGPPCEQGRQSYSGIGQAEKVRAPRSLAAPDGLGLFNRPQSESNLG